MITQRPIGEYYSSGSPIVIRIKPFQSQVAVHENQDIVHKLCFKSDVSALSALSENIRSIAARRDVIDICADLPVNLSKNPAQETTDPFDLGLYHQLMLI